MSFDPQPLLILPAMLYWLAVAGGLALLVLLVSVLVVFVGHRAAGGRMFFGELRGCLSDLFSLSAQRVWALSKLTFLEAYRRKALAVFVVFALLMMFAGWFMGDTKEITNDQVKVYISFVLRAISWLTLPVVLVLCCFGIPEDIRLRSLHTVVTKPARRLEIVLGRIIGFSLIGTVVLLVMSTVGYIWIVRQIPQSAKEQGLLSCRVPVYGKLTFRDREGNPVDKGINVGDLWEFRSFIEGATAARAIWTFPNIDASALDAEGNLHLENQFQAFRSYKGDMKRSLLFDYRIVNDEKKLSHTTKAQQVREFRGVTDVIPRKLVSEGDNNTELDLIDDFIAKDGSLTIHVSCIDREQYLGMARPDLFIRKPDQPFWYGYLKAVLGLELMVILVAIMGVTASTFLKGPIATVLVFCLLILGGEDSHKFMDELVEGKFKGGGFLESIYRIVMHMNPTTELPDNPAFVGMQFFDGGLTYFLWLCKQIIPRLQYFNMSEYVSNGFDVPWDSSVIPSLMVTLGYFVPCVLLGYFALRIRELESK